MRLLTRLALLTLFVSSHALKRKVGGVKGASRISNPVIMDLKEASSKRMRTVRMMQDANRLLKEAPDKDDDDAKKVALPDEAKHGGGKGLEEETEKNVGKDDGSDKASPKKGDKDKKKCKKAKKGKDDKALKEKELPYCLHGKRSEKECKNLKNGKLPKGDRSIKGDLSIEIAYADDSSSASVLEKVEEILRNEVPTQYAGCKSMPSTERRFLSEIDDAEEEEEEEKAVSVTGVNFNGWKILDTVCASSGTDEGCDAIASTVDIFYQSLNDPTEAEQQDMYDLLIATVESLSAEGAFEDIGTVKSVASKSSATVIDDEGNEETNDREQQDSPTSGTSLKNENENAEDPKDGPPIGIVIGVIVGALVIGGLLYNYVIAKDDDDENMEKGEETSDSESDDDQNHNGDSDLEASTNPVKDIVVEADAVIIEDWGASTKSMGKKK